MSKKMPKIMKDILKMPYYKNYAAASGAVHNITKHEDAVENILIKHGLNFCKMKDIKISKPTGEFYKKNGKGFSKGDSKMKELTSTEKRNYWMEGEDLDFLPDNTYMSQPCGTHDSPDFIIKVDGRAYFIECKSSKQPQPTFNSGLPKKGYIYIFSSAKTNSTTLFRGEDIVTDMQRKMIEESQSEIRQAINALNTKLKRYDHNKRGVELYHRPMWNQCGGADLTNYFEHFNRKSCERGVLKYVS